jgi:hypothetical protein
MEFVLLEEPDKMDAHGTNAPLFLGLFGRSQFAFEDSIEHRADSSWQEDCPGCEFFFLETCLLDERRPFGPKEQ